MPRPTPRHSGGPRATAGVDSSWPSDYDLAQIQGIVLHAYGMPFAAHALLTITDAGPARQFIGKLIDPKSGVPNIQFATVWDTKPPTCMNISFTCTGLSALGMAAGTFENPPGSMLADYLPFVNGSAYNIPAGTGQQTGALQVGDIGPNAPANWIFKDVPAGPADDDVVHVDIVVYGTLRKDVLDQVAALNAAYTKAGFRELAVLESQDVLPHGEIYWNIQDGISDPTLYPNNPTNQPPEAPLISGIAERDPFMADPGAFVLGQSQMPATDPASYENMLLPTPRRAFEYGTFAALRRLEQHIDDPVTGFNAFLDANTEAMQNAYTPPLDNPAYARAALEAAIIGRWPSGVSLMHTPISPGVTDPPGPLPIDDRNNFVYGADVGFNGGVQCPYTSHIRRANPRDGTVSGGIVPMHRIMRRAFPYQAPYVDGDQCVNERGLFGFFISASLTQGFEFVMGDWINGIGTPARDAADPAIGYPKPPADPPPYTLTVSELPPTPGQWNPNVQRVQFQLSPFVRTRGSAYVFMPGLPGLQWIAEGCPES